MPTPAHLTIFHFWCYSGENPKTRADRWLDLGVLGDNTPAREKKTTPKLPPNFPQNCPQIFPKKILFPKNGLSEQAQTPSKQPTFFFLAIFSAPSALLRGHLNLRGGEGCENGRRRLRRRRPFSHPSRKVTLEQNKRPEATNDYKSYSICTSLVSLETIHGSISFPSQGSFKPEKEAS